ncbi:MAG: hypothetical protein ABSF26_27875 [Thermoguttaceae bacterium]
MTAIEKSGGSAWYYEDALVKESGFYGTRWANRKAPGPLWLRRLLGDDFFTSVVEADLRSDADFDYLKQFDRLTRLRCGPGVTVAGLTRLRELPRLRNLDLRGNRAVGAGLEQITALTEGNGLDLRYTNIGDAELERLKSMPRLSYLGLAGTKITDAGLRHLEGLTHLEELCLDLTQIGDAGVEHLKRHRQSLPRTRPHPLSDVDSSL